MPQDYIIQPTGVGQLNATLIYAIAKFFFFFKYSGGIQYKPNTMAKSFLYNSCSTGNPSKDTIKTGEKDGEVPCI